MGVARVYSFRILRGSGGGCGGACERVGGVGPFLRWVPWSAKALGAPPSHPALPAPSPLLRALGALGAPGDLRALGALGALPPPPPLRAARAEGERGCSRRSRPTVARLPATPGGGWAGS